MIAIDFETYLIGDPDVIPKPVCVSYWDGQHGGVLSGDEMKAFLLHLFNSEQLVIAHNMKFEALVIYKYFPTLRNRLIHKMDNDQLVCTKIAEKLIGNISKVKHMKHSLDALVERYFGEDISSTKSDPDAWRLRYAELAQTPVSQWPSEAYTYALEDSKWAFKVWGLQRTLAPDYGLSVKSEIMLGIMGSTGITIDRSRVEQLEKEISDKITPIYKDLSNRGLCEQKICGRYKKNIKDLQAYVADKVTGKIYTAKNSLKVSKEALEKYYKETQDPVFKAFLDISEYEKVTSAFTSRLKQADPLIYSDYNAVVSTGRTSSHTSHFYPSVNIQQMPRKVEDVTWDVRNCFVPREGFKLVAIDYAGLELAATAHQLYSYYGESKLSDTLNSGDKPTDLHSKLAARLMSLKRNTNVDYDHFITHKKEAEYKHYRQLAKPINLGFPGGIGYDTMRGLLLKDSIVPEYHVIKKAYCEKGLSWLLKSLKKEFNALRIHRTGRREYSLVYDELVQIKQELFDMYPELGQFLRYDHKRFLTGETKNIKNDWGEWESEPMYRYNVQGFKRDWCTYTALCNGYLMQAPSALGAKTMVYDVMKRYHDDPRVNILAFIHDEIVFEVLDNDNKYAIVKDIEKIMVDSMQKVLSTVRIAVEASVMDYWDKGGGDWEDLYWRDK